MTAPSRIFLGDLVRALAATDPEGAEWTKAAVLLGFGPAARDPEPGPRLPPPPPPDGQAATPEAPLRSDAPAHEVSEVAMGEPIAFDVERETAPPLSLPSPPAPASVREPAAPRPFRPLLDPLWERGVLIEAIGRQVPEGDIDVTAAVEAIARAEALMHVPRHLARSVSKGCQLLVDRGTGMRPFARDTQQLVAAVRRAVGLEHTHVLTFVDCPVAGVLNDRYEDEPYAPPENGALVLAASDLGAGGPGSALRRGEIADWLRLARIVRDAGSLLVVMNPYPPASWPRAVTSRVPVVYWDRRTQANDVRHSRRGRR